MKLKLTALLVATGLVATGCQTTNVDTALAENLPKVCSAFETGYLAFQAATVSGEIKQSTINKVDKAYAGVQVLCSGDAPINTADAIIRVTLALATVTAALKEAKDV